MKTPEEISQAIRDDYFRRYGSWVVGGLNEETLDTLIVGAVSPLCQRIECLTAALRGLVDALDEDGDSGIESTEILRLRAILGDS